MPDTYFGLIHEIDTLLKSRSIAISTAYQHPLTKSEAEKIITRFSHGGWKGSCKVAAHQSVFTFIRH